MERLAPYVGLIILACIAVSNSVAGFCARAAVVVPLYWAGEFAGHPIISEATTQAAVLWHLF